jgi:hypothetical protein
MLIPVGFAGRDYIFILPPPSFVFIEISKYCRLNHFMKHLILNF